MEKNNEVKYLIEMMIGKEMKKKKKNSKGDEDLWIDLRLLGWIIQQISIVLLSLSLSLEMSFA